MSFPFGYLFFSNEIVLLPVFPKPNTSLSFPVAFPFFCNEMVLLPVFPKPNKDIVPLRCVLLLTVSFAAFSGTRRPFSSEMVSLGLGAKMSVSEKLSLPLGIFVSELKKYLRPLPVVTTLPLLILPVMMGEVSTLSPSLKPGDPNILPLIPP